MHTSKTARGRSASARPEPWHPPAYEIADLRAVQALARGEASAEQQQRALDWIVSRAAQTYDEPFFPDNPRVTDYLLGRRSVGLALVKLTRLKAGVVAATDNLNKVDER